MSILDKALQMQREQESFTGGGARVNAEQSKAKGANKKKQFIDTLGDDDEFETTSSAYSLNSKEELDAKGRDKIFASKSSAAAKDFPNRSSKKSAKANLSRATTPASSSAWQLITAPEPNCSMPSAKWPPRSS